MQTNVKQVFYFNAAATSIGGFLENSYRNVPTPCSVALSSSGGAVTSQTKGFAFEDGLKESKGGIKATSAYTSVSGQPDRQNGPWIQRAVSVVEGFSLLDRITADLLVAQIFIEHPEIGGGPRRISFAGTKFVNLRVDNKPLLPESKPLGLTMDATLLPPDQADVDAYNQDAKVKPVLKWPDLTSYARTQGQERILQKNLPDWGRDRFGWIADTRKNANSGVEGYTLCSLVKKIDGVTSGQTFAHCIDLPDVGRIFLAEVTIHPFAAHLTMLRAELGCSISGHVSAAVIQSNGTTMPPNVDN
jgi:hypothetical protein